MNYLLDTCVISELARQQADQLVMDWVDQAAEMELYLSVITIGELKKGIDRLPPSPRKDVLEAWLHGDLLERFHGRVVSLDLAVLLAWSGLVARLEAIGRKMPAIDSLIAATALEGNFALVTRNIADFDQAGVTLVNPWS